MKPAMSSRPVSPRPVPAHPVGPARRPHRIALVLGSGGVRSIAAVGIVERLARDGLRPDLVVGCSSGALFGALIASGVPAAEALRDATTLWSAELTQRRRWCAYPQLVAPRLAGFDERFSLRDNRQIAERLQLAFGEARLENLPTPLRVVTTDARSGERVVLEHGRLVDALLASMAVPLLFPSVEIEGRRLLDGVISDPLPVSAAEDADLVIALGFEGPMPRRIDRASRLAAQATTALINNLMEARLDAARARGQPVIELALALDRHVGLWETAALPYLFEAGQQAAADALPCLRAALDRHGHGHGRAPAPAPMPTPDDDSPPAVRAWASEGPRAAANRHGPGGGMDAGGSVGGGVGGGGMGAGGAAGLGRGGVAAQLQAPR